MAASSGEEPSSTTMISPPAIPWRISALRHARVNAMPLWTGTTIEAGGGSRASLDSTATEPRLQPPPQSCGPPHTSRLGGVQPRRHGLQLQTEAVALGGEDGVLCRQHVSLGLAHRGPTCPRQGAELPDQSVSLGQLQMHLAQVVSQLTFARDGAFEFRRELVDDIGWVAPVQLTRHVQGVHAWHIRTPPGSIVGVRSNRRANGYNSLRRRARGSP